MIIMFSLVIGDDEEQKSTMRTTIRGDYANLDDDVTRMSILTTITMTRNGNDNDDKPNIITTGQW